jgi:hypothetical protein
MAVWLLWTVSDETLEDLLLSIHATQEAAEAALEEFRDEDPDLDTYWVKEWAVRA